MKLKIIAPNIVGHEVKLYLDDKKLENVTDITVNISACKINQAIITFIPTELEIEGDFKVDENYAK